MRAVAVKGVVAIYSFMGPDLKEYYVNLTEYYQSMANLVTFCREYVVMLHS